MSVSLGYVCRAFGIKGGVVVKLYVDHSQSFVPGKELILRKKDQNHISFIIESFADGRLFLKDIVNREGAELLIGAEVSMDREHLPCLQDDEFYLTDLEGARVLDMLGALVGHVVGFSSNNAQDLLQVKTTHEVLISIPIVKPIVHQIDYLHKIVTIDPPLGLLDLAA